MTDVVLLFRYSVAISLTNGELPGKLGFYFWTFRAAVR